VKTDLHLAQSSTTNLKGKICLVTGANSGIGKATATGLAALGATVVLVCRDSVKGETALNEVKTKTGNNSVSMMIADLSSLQSIKQFADDFKSKYKQLHVLINNAGVHLATRRLTVDGNETTFAVNYLAPFLLTNLLLNLLETSSPSRIVNLTSRTAGGAHIDLKDIQGLGKKFNGMRTYNQSKLAIIMFTYELAKKLEGTGVTVNCLHPGVIKTNLGRDFRGPFGLVFSFMRIFFGKPEKAAEQVIYLASSPDVAGVTGKYFVKSKESNSNSESYNPSTNERLWKESVTLTGFNVQREKVQPSLSPA